MVRTKVDQGRGGHLNVPSIIIILTRRSMATRTTTMEVSIKHSSTSAPQTVFYPTTSLPIRQSNSDGPVTKFTSQPENNL